jgi:hypothetical protein
MRTVVILSLLVLGMSSISSHGAEPVKVGGDFGTAWLKNLPYQERFSTEGDEGGLWSWGGTPRWMKLINGTLEPVVIGDEDVDYNADLAWLGYSLGAPVMLNQSDVPVELSNANFLSPYYSDDPWILAQHYGVPIRTPADWYD